MIAQALARPRLPLGRRLLPLALTMLAAGLRITTLTYQSLWRDEVDALRFATQPASQLLAMFSNPAQNGPLFFLGLRPWIAVAGNSEFGLRLPSALLGTLAIPVAYALIHRLAGRAAAVLAALFMATAPYLVWYGQEAKMYAPLTVLVPASLLSVLVVARHGRWLHWLALYVLTSLAFYTHLLAVLSIPVQLLWLLALLPGPLVRRLAKTTVYLALLVLPYLPLLAWQRAFFVSPPQTGFAIVPFGDMLQVLAVGFSLGVWPLATRLALLPAMLLLAAGALLPYLMPGEQKRSGQQTAVILLLVWLLLPPLLLYITSLRVAVFTDRYLIWTAPAFVGLLAIGTTFLYRAWRPLGITALLPLLVLFGIGYIRQVSQPIKADFRAAAALVRAARGPNDVLLYQIPYNRYTFSYYASNSRDPNDSTWQGIDGPYTNDGVSQETVEGWLEDKLGNARTVWLIASEVSLWDNRNLTSKWFQEHALPVTSATYQGVGITRYELESQP